MARALERVLTEWSEARTHRSHTVGQGRRPAGAGGDATELRDRRGRRDSLTPHVSCPVACAGWATAISHTRKNFRECWEYGDEGSRVHSQVSAAKDRGAAGAPPAARDRGRRDIP